MPQTTSRHDRIDTRILFREHESQLRDLYLTQDKTLREVKTIMETIYGFPKDLSLNHYETRLKGMNMRKNIKGGEWLAIGANIEGRKGAGKTSEVFLCGVRKDNVKKEIQRAQASAQEKGVGNAHIMPLPDEIVIRTPPQSPELMPQGLHDDLRNFQFEGQAGHWQPIESLNDTYQNPEFYEPLVSDTDFGFTYDDWNFDGRDNTL